jgi:CheY-like chemotaxis protein
MSAAGELFVVDDNPNNIELLSRILRSAGYSVRIANHGRRALEAILVRAPEMVLLDVNMPELSGYDVCRQLKADTRTVDIPVIFLSALDDVNDKIEAFRAGAVDYITKPFHADEVLARVSTQLKLVRMRKEVEERSALLVRRNEELQNAARNQGRTFLALADVLPGTVLDGKYQLGPKIGSGGFSAVYRGLQVDNGFPVAVKILRTDPLRDQSRQLERFQHESVVATRLDHPNAVTVLDSGVSEHGIAYLVMELLRGKTLEDELSRNRLLPLYSSVSIISDVGDALTAAHHLGMVHRDIKPANVFLHQASSGMVVKVIDFGLAKLFADRPTPSSLTTMGEVVGTPVYMSPERLRQQAYDYRADVYSVGVMLYQMITGRLPFDVEDGSLADVMVTCLTKEPRPLRQLDERIPVAVEQLIMRAISKDPDLRPTIAELVGALRHEIDPALLLEATQRFASTPLG